MIFERNCSWPRRAGGFIGLYLLLLPVCMANAPAGKVIIAAGEAWAAIGDQTPRALKRRSEVFAGDTLFTGAGGRLQVRFSDGSLLDLAAGSELHIDDYHFDAAQPETGRSVATLVKGGFRTITGLIGKQDPDAYRINTPVATIGVRGTHYELRLSETLAVGVWKGGVRITNEAGSFDIGEGAAFNFARIDSARQLPKGLLAPPAALEGETPPPPAPETETEVDAEPQTATEEPATTDSSDPGSADDSGTIETVDSSTTEDSLITLDSTGDDSGELALVTTDTGTLSEPNFVPEPISTTLTDTTTVVTFTDARLSDLESQRLADDQRIGIMILSGPEPKNFPNDFGSLTGGKATASDLGPVITTSVLDPVDDGFDAFLAADIESVFRAGSASQLPPPSPVPANPGFSVEWGAWDATAAIPVEVQTDATDPGVVAFVTQPVFWTTLVPATQAAIDARSDIGVFSNLVAAFGHTSDGVTGSAILTGDMTFNAVIDFSTGAISSGDITLGLSPSSLPAQWLVNFTGQLDGPLVNIDHTNVTGTVSGAFGVHSINGEVGALLTGPSVNAIGGGFSFHSQTDGNVHAEGVFVVSE